jgi:hypothetical protein
MKKIQLRLFAVIIILFFLLPLFFISNPKPLYADDVTITLKSVVKGAGAPNYLNGANSVFVSGDYAYVVSCYDASLSIFNISNPSNPMLAGSIRGAGAPNYLDGAIDVFVSGNYAYVASANDASLSIFDIRSPSNPTLAGVIGGANYLNGAYSVFVIGNYAYVISLSYDSLSIFDIFHTLVWVQKPSFSYEKTTTGFVTMFYNGFLDRAPEKFGLDTWVYRFGTGEITGSYLVTADDGFLFGPECQYRIKDYTDSEFITFLYRALFVREPDSYGHNAWLARMSAGMTRKEVAEGFTQSEEFAQICKYFNVKP